MWIGGGYRAYIVCQLSCAGVRFLMCIWFRSADHILQGLDEFRGIVQRQSR